jgi:hypothetical protein
MTRFLQVLRCSHPSHWTSRLLTLGGVLCAFGVAVAWNPLTHPGPKCCLLRMAVGLPCPLCGMTRGIALCVRGRFLEATWYNPLAVPVFIAALALCMKWTFEIATTRKIEVVLPSAWNTGLRAGLYGVVLASWAYLLVFRREDDFAATWLGQLLHLCR